jgi:hypothetical protein
LQPVAISGKSTERGNGGNTPKPLAWVATGCLRRSMVSRACAVRCHPLREVPPWEGGGRSPLKRQVLRTRRPTGLDGATLTRRGFTVKWPHGRAPPDRRRLGLAIYVVRCSASSPAITGASSPRRCSAVGAFRSGRRSFSLEHVRRSCVSGSQERCENRSCGRSLFARATDDVRNAAF